MERELPLLYLEQDNIMVKLTDGREMTLAEYEAMVDINI